MGRGMNFGIRRPSGSGSSGGPDKNTGGWAVAMRRGTQRYVRSAHCVSREVRGDMKANYDSTADAATQCEQQLGCCDRVHLSAYVHLILVQRYLTVLALLSTCPCACTCGTGRPPAASAWSINA